MLLRSTLFLLAFASALEKRAIVFTLPNEDSAGIPFEDESREIEKAFSRKEWQTEVMTLPTAPASNAEYLLTYVSVMQLLKQESSEKLLIYINGHGNEQLGPFFAWEDWGNMINEITTTTAKEVAVFIDSCHSGHLQDFLELGEDSNIKIFSYSACKGLSSRYTKDRALARLLTGEWKSSVKCTSHNQPWKVADIEGMIEDGKLVRMTETSVDSDEFNDIRATVNLKHLMKVHAGAEGPQCKIHGKFCRGWHLGKGKEIMAKDWDICPYALQYEVNNDEGITKHMVLTKKYEQKL